MIGFHTIGKIGLKIVKVVAVAAGVGYVDYRMKGGKPIYQVYREVKAERVKQCTQQKVDELMERIRRTTI